MEGLCDWARPWGVGHHFSSPFSSVRFYPCRVSGAYCGVHMHALRSTWHVGTQRPLAHVL